MHLSTEESQASWMVKLFGKVGRGVPEYITFHWRSFSIKDVVRNDVVRSYHEKTDLTLQLEFKTTY